MRSIWIATGRDAEFGDTHTVEDICVFESSFDAYDFIAATKHSRELPEKVRNLIWAVNEMPIHPNKTEALIDFYKINREYPNDDN